MGMMPRMDQEYGNLLVELSSTTEDASCASPKAQAGCSMRSWQPSPRSESTPLLEGPGIAPLVRGAHSQEAPAGFRGELRPYQQEGLGWLEYSRSFEFGGILADDMGLGKTVQVLAHLQSRRSRRLSKGPSLIVVPRSLVFNWIQEAERFTPRMKVLDYTGPNRHILRDGLGTMISSSRTYGTLRTDIIELGRIDV